MPPSAPATPGEITVSAPAGRPIAFELLSILPLPLRILLTGAAIAAVLGAGVALGLPGPEALFAAFAAPGATGLPALIGMMIFLVGIGFAAFLWWLAARSFALVTNPAIGPERLAGLRDLPLALPEGTVRALLALIVGVIGLPLLLFSKTLGLTDAIAGYVNGIVTGVFGFYFGTRSTGADAQNARRASEQLAERERANGALAAEAAALLEKAEGAARDAALPGRIEDCNRCPGGLDQRAALGAPAARRGILAAGWHGARAHWGSGDGDWAWLAFRRGGISALARTRFGCPLRAAVF